MYNDALMSRYLDLIVGIINVSIDDYMKGRHWIINNPEPNIDKESVLYLTWKYNKNSCDRKIASTIEFFNSQRFAMYTRGNTSLKDYLIEHMEKIANVGTEVKFENKVQKVNNYFFEVATKILTERVEEVIKEGYL